jgi:hypothetical protein
LEKLPANRAKAFDLAAEVAKQLIALSSGIVAITVTFATDLFAKAPNSPTWLLVSGWAVYTASAFFGVFTLCCLAGNLELTPDGEQCSIYKYNVRLWQSLQILLFFMASVFMIVYASFGLSAAPRA